MLQKLVAKSHLRLKYLSLKAGVMLRKIKLPGFDHVPLLDVVLFFWNGIVNGAISTRASGIAFSFFLAIFPAIIFFFTLIPYIPFENFQAELLLMIQGFLPQAAFTTVEDTINDIVLHKRGDLLSFGFIAALVFSTNGIAAMISAFNATVNSFESRPWIGQRLISLLLAVIFVILVTIAVGMIMFSRYMFEFLQQHHIIQQTATFYLIYAGKWIIVLALFFIAISFLYYLAPAKKIKWQFISAGSSLATILIIVTSIGFSYYINNFGQYNKLYGSIGTIMVVLLWLYINSFVLLIGFELNTSIQNARMKKKHKLEFSEQVRQTKSHI